MDETTQRCEDCGIKVTGTQVLETLGMVLCDDCYTNRALNILERGTISVTE